MSEYALQPKVNKSSGRAQLDLAAFALEQATLEIRYPVALKFWDSAGAVWQRIQEKWPDIVLAHAEPARTIFRAGNTALTIELESARITTTTPDRSMEEFGANAKVFAAVVVEQLGIRVFKRIGFRPVYFRQFDSREDAAASFFSLGLLRLPDNKRFEISATPVEPQYALRWESDAKGLFLQIRAETRKLDFEPPADLAREIKPVHRERSGITFDVDYYTVAPVEPAQIDAAEWVKHAVHLINRDSRYVFEG